MRSSHRSKRRSSLKKREAMHDNQMTTIMMNTRSGRSFWLVFLILFLFWYSLIYGSDWSSLPGIMSLISREEHRETPLQSRSNLMTDSSNDSVSNVVSVSLPSQSYSSTDQDPTTGNDRETPPQPRSNLMTDSSNDSVSNVVSVSLPNQSYSSTDQDPTTGNDREIGDREGLQKELESPISVQESDSCRGRYIYIHDLPPKFNLDLIKQCRLINKWRDMCPYFDNKGLGQRMGNPQRLFLNSGGWYDSHQFLLEVIFHNRMKQYDCLTNDSSKANGLFVPYYPGLDVSRHLWDQYNTSVKDADSVELVKLLRGKPEWKVMGGRDHFMVAGRITWEFRRVIDDDSGWGNKLMMLPESQNMSILTIESSPWNKNDFAIPYPTYFHPSSRDQILQWQIKIRRTKRRALFCFVGGSRPNMKGSIRGELMEQCISAKQKCKMLECKDATAKCSKPVNVMRLFQSSIFCLQPPGDSFTRRSTFDSILAGCIPVFFHPASAYVQYIWHLPKNYNKYSVLIPEEEVKNKTVSIERVLSQIPGSRVAAMREEVIKLIPKVSYADPRSRLEGVEDAFDLAVKGVVARVEAIRLGKRSENEFDEENSWKYYTFQSTKQHEWDHFFDRAKLMFNY